MRRREKRLFRMSKFIYPLKCKEGTGGAMNEEKRAYCILHVPCLIKLRLASIVRISVGDRPVKRRPFRGSFLFFLLHLSSYGWLWCTFSYFARRPEMLSVREESAIKTRQGGGTSCNIPMLCLLGSAWGGLKGSIEAWGFAAWGLVEKGGTAHIRFSLWALVIQP